MSINRLTSDHNVTEDCIVSHAFPMKAEDPPGFYLGKNKDGSNLYITYWVAAELAQMIGYPPLEVVEEREREILALQLEIDQRDAEFDEAVQQHVDNRFIELLAKTKDEILEEQKRTTRSLRDASKFATDPDASRTAKLGGGEGGA